LQERNLKRYFKPEFKLTDAEIYNINRRRGTIDQAVHLPLRPTDTEICSMAAQREVAKEFGIDLLTEFVPDNGDIIIPNQLTKAIRIIGVKWTPVRNGHLIVKLKERVNHYAYVLVTGKKKDAEWIIHGWCEPHDLKKDNFGYGPCLSREQNLLNDFDDLISLIDYFKGEI
jgi:hypothetical protein